MHIEAESLENFPACKETYYPDFIYKIIHFINKMFYFYQKKSE